MKTEVIERILYTNKTKGIEGVRVGRIVNVGSNGEIFVDFPGNCNGPIKANIATSVKRIIIRSRRAVDRGVLLIFEDNDPEYPVIIDTIEENVYSPTVLTDNDDIPDEAIMDGERIVLEAGREMVLKCGKSSITLTRAGKVLIRGAHIVSRSSGANKIKGASIELN